MATTSRPTTVTVAFIIWFVVVVINIISGIITLVSGGGSAATADSVGTGPLIGGAIFAFIIAILELIVVFKMRDGRNWARIVLTVLAILQLIGVGVGAASGGNALGWIGGLAVLVATILMYVGTRGYFSRR